MSSLSAIPSSETSSLSPTPRSALHRTLQPQAAYRSSLIIPRTAPRRGILHHRRFHHQRVKVLPGASALPGRHVAIPGSTFGLARRSTSGLGPAKIGVAFRPSCRQGARLISLADKQVETLELGDGTPPLCELALWRSFSPSTQAINVSILSLFSSQLSSTNPSKLCKPCLCSC